MKQMLIPKLDITLKESFNQAKSQSLKILSCNNDELRVYLNEQMNTNPLLNYTYGKQTNSEAFLAYDNTDHSLYEEIMQQVRLSKYSPDKNVCEFLLLHLNSNGYFKCSYRFLLEHSPYSKAVIKKHIAILRTFEPYGLFAFDLRECLQIQCKLKKNAVSETAFILCSYLEELALNHIDDIIAKTNLTHSQINGAYAFIKTLNPKPAANYTATSMYINPEFSIHVQEEKIHIELLSDDLSISLNKIDNENESHELQAYMRRQRAQVKNIMNSIQKRNMTLMQIMHFICDRQRDFFIDHGSIHHLTLAMIAENCNLHISTISRAISNKSFEFEKQYYPIKKMLSSGGTMKISADEIKKLIIDLIKLENKKHPYSDEELKQLLHKQDIDLSRRVIAKYRDSCHIYCSSKRRIK